MARKIIATLSLLLTVGCLRSTDPLPERPEGIVFTGQVVQRGGPSGDWTGAKGVAVTAAGIGVAATTNADGKFRLTRLPINHFITLRLTAARTSSAAQARLPQSRVLEPERALFDREVLDLGTIELGPGGALEGRALLSDGLGVPPVGVGGTLVVVPTTTFKAVTDVDGRFQLPDLPEGTFELVAFHPGYLPARLERVGVFPGGTINTKDLVLAKGAAQDVSVRGRARILGDDTDTGHAGITVRFGVEGTEDPIFETTTGPDGQYAASLAPGVYHVTATRDGYGKVLLQGVAVLPEGVLGLVDIYLAAPTDGDGDGDGLLDSEDEDDDNDGCIDEFDDFPQDPAFCVDTDGDGLANEVDDDDDGDGLLDAEEVSEGADGWVTSPLDPDTDGDQVNDRIDVCPTVPDDQTDSDGDGRGDACPPEVSSGTDYPAPVITRFSPAEAGAGAALEILGRNLDDPIYGGASIQLQFGYPANDGAIAVPTEVAAGRLLFTVPPNASTGRLILRSHGLTTTSSDTFTFRPSPNVVAMSPTAGRRGSRVVVIGQSFDQAGLAAYVNGVQATLLPFDSGALVEARVLDGQLYDAIQLQVPDTTSGPLEVRNDFGAGQASDPFVVTDAGIVINEATPNPAPLGGLITLAGIGFSTSDLVNPTVPEVIFNYGGAEIRQAIEPGWTDTLASVVVPAAASTGPIALAHPAATTPVVYREALQIVPNLPYLTGADPLVVMPGDTLNLYGGNLQSVTQVALGGGVTVSSGITASPGALQLTVPAGVQPGPIAVTNPFGVATSAFRLGLMVASPVTTLAYAMLPRPGFGVNGDEFYALLNTASGQGNQVIVASSSGPGSAPQVLRTVSLSPILGSASEYVENMVVAPSGQIAILQTNQAVNPGGRLLTVGLPAFNLIGVCLLARANNVYEPSVVFDGTTTAAYAHQPTNTADATQDGVLRIDLSDGSCEELFVGPKQGPLAISAQLPQGRSLLLAHQSRGSAVMDVDPASPLYGTLTSPWVSWPNTSATMLRIFSGPGTELFYESSQGGLGRFDPQSGVAPVVIPSAASGSGVVPDGARRYFLVAVSTVGPVLVDATLTPPRAVRSGLSFFYPHRAAAKPGTHTFFSSTTNASGLLRVDIYP